MINEILFGNIRKQIKINKNDLQIFEAFLYYSDIKIIIMLLEDLKRLSENCIPFVLDYFPRIGENNFSQQDIDYMNEKLCKFVKQIFPYYDRHENITNE